MPTARVSVRVQPRARANEIVGLRDDVLIVRVTAPPEGGKANAAVCRLVANELGIPKSRVQVVLGGAARNKVLEIAEMDEREVLRALGTRKPLQD
jgi:uncharacterized protein (TIGR00251 family)